MPKYVEPTSTIGRITSLNSAVTTADQEITSDKQYLAAETV